MTFPRFVYDVLETTSENEVSIWFVKQSHNYLYDNPGLSTIKRTNYIRNTILKERDIIDEKYGDYFIEKIVKVGDILWNWLDQIFMEKLEITHCSK